MNAAGDAWDDIPGHHIGTTAPVAASRFLGQIWLDTTDTTALSLKAYNGTDFVEVGGDGGSASVYAFSATLADLADIASGTAFANLTSGLTAGELVNQGSGFTVETAASRDQVVIANAGTYLVTGSLSGDADASTLGTSRSVFRARIARERSSVVTGLAPEGAPTYSRNQYGNFSERLGSAVSGVYEFEAGDKIEIQGLFEGQGTTVQLDLVGARSGISIVAVGAGPKGDQGDIGPSGGPEGPAGQDGNDGSDGADGATGAAGAAGVAGAAGAAGTDGTAGADGAAGGQGVQGLYDVTIYRNATALPPTPVGGTVNVESGVVSPPANWNADPTTPGVGENTYASKDTVNPSTQSGDITPSWSSVFEAGGIGPAGADGADGAAGADGATGAAGADGATGTAGAELTGQTVQTGLTLRPTARY